MSWSDSSDLVRMHDADEVVRSRDRIEGDLAHAAELVGGDRHEIEDADRRVGREQR